MLASVRFFLACSVAFGHYSFYIKSDALHLFGDAYFNPLGSVFGFFLLSGYSIAASLEREQSGFYMRRAIRIWPLYIATTLYALAVRQMLPENFAWPLGDAMGYYGPAMLVSIFMLQGMLWFAPPAIVGVTWSLSVEWWLYTVAPLLKRLPAIVLLVLIAASLLFFVRANAPNLNIQSVAGWAGSKWGAALWGLSWIWITGFIYRGHRGTPFGIAAILVPPLFVATMGYSPGTAYFLTAGALFLSHGARLPHPVRRFFKYLGDLSFPLYLVHIPTFALMVHLGHHKRAALVAASILVAAIFLGVVDYPARKVFKNRTRARSSNAISSAVPSN